MKYTKKVIINKYNLSYLYINLVNIILKFIFKYVEPKNVFYPL